MKPALKRTLIDNPVLLLAILFLAGLCAYLQAQEDFGKGRISGRVVDESGTPLEGALITAQSLQFKTTFHGKSDKKGRFAIAGLGSGTWRVTASKEGYTPASEDQDVSELIPNLPVPLTLKKLPGIAAFTSDKNTQKVNDQANAWLDQGNYDDALKSFLELSARYPQILQIHMNVGTCHLKKGDLDHAEAEFKLVLDKATAVEGGQKTDVTSSVRALSGLGEIAARKGDLETAKGYFTKALEISPQDQLAALNIGEILFSSQQFDEAIEYFKKAIQIKKDWPKPYIRLGYVYLNKGDYARSLEFFKKFIELDPASPDAPQVKNVIDTLEKMKK